MPSDPSIAIMVLGGVLLLIALLGGKFKIFGVEILEKTGPLSRTVAGLIGLVLLMVGIGLTEQAGTPDPEIAVAVRRSAHTALAAAYTKPQTGSPLSMYFTGPALQALMQQNHEEDEADRRDGLNTFSELVGLDFDSIEISRDGRRAEVAARVSVFVRMRSTSKCLEGYSKPFTVRLTLQRDSQRWMAHRISGGTDFAAAMEQTVLTAC
jgi:hypothetical protein